MNDTVFYFVQIGTDEECTELLNILENDNQSKNDGENRTFVIDDDEGKSNSESEDEELESSTNNEGDSIVTMQSMQSTNIDNAKTTASMKSSAQSTLKDVFWHFIFYL